MTHRVRINHIGSACTLHYGDFPLRINRGSKQYIYDNSGVEYLDCVSAVCHVGHCHPNVVRAACQQMACLNSAYGFLVDAQTQYVAKLLEKLPEKLSVFYFTNSGSEANDLAIRLARAHTKAHDVVVVDGSFHGHLQILTDCSPKYLASQRVPKQEWVHVVPAPDRYRGKYRDTKEENLTSTCFSDFSHILNSARERGRRVAAFLAEPILSGAGMIELPKNYLKLCYNLVREHGGVCIADEVVVGLGRTGETFWAFQQHDVIPDILVLGKTVGNGFPLGLVITSKQIADSIPQFNNTLGGNPVACVVGTSVIEVMQNEQLQQAAKYVGRCLLDGLRGLQKTHPMVGQVRGLGLAIGVEIVTDPDSRKPAREVAATITYKLRIQEHIILANEGPDKNVLIITPPLCFTCENARRVVSALDSILSEVEKGAALNHDGRGPELVNFSMLVAPDGGGDADSTSWMGDSLKSLSVTGFPAMASQRLARAPGERLEDGGSASDDDQHAPAKIPRYEDVD